MIKTHIALLFALLSLFLFSCEKKSGKVVGTNLVDFTIEEQIKIGEVLQETIESNRVAFDILEQAEYPDAYEYLNILLNTLLNTPMVTHRNEFDWDISIIHNDTLRTAFVLPGGKAYVYTGLLKYLDAEHQLLSVLGHELYYADTELMVQRLRAAFSGIVMGDLVLDNEVEDLDNMIEEIPYMGFTPEEVMEADSYSVDILCLFQYSPLGIKHLIEKEPGNENVHWLDSRSCDEVMRINNLETLTQGCAIGGVTNESSYQDFVQNDLPQ